MVQDTDTSTYASAWVADTSYTWVEWVMELKQVLTICYFILRGKDN